MEPNDWMKKKNVGLIKYECKNMTIDSMAFMTYSYGLECATLYQAPVLSVQTEDNVS